MRDGGPSTNLDNLNPNDATEVITLVDNNGCRNEEYRVSLWEMTSLDGRIWSSFVYDF
jgi:hypothetical protein